MSDKIAQFDADMALARLALEVGLLPLARRHAERAADVRADDASTLLLGRVRLNEPRRHQTKIARLPSHAAEAVMDPRLGERLGHAQSLVEADELEMARAACLATLSVWPAAVRGWLMLACIDVELGEPHDAAMALEQALRWQPHHASVRRVLRALQPHLLAKSAAARKAA